MDTNEKITFLKNNNFKYNFKRDIYVNFIRKIIISLEAIEDHDINWIKNEINLFNQEDDWNFLFNELPDDNLKKDILNEIIK